MYIAIKILKNMWKRNKWSLYILLFVIVSICTFCFGVWSMGKFDSRPSSICDDCSFYRDLVFMSVAYSFVYILFQLVILKIKSIVLRITVQLLLLLMMWYDIASSIFIIREASWSTYTSGEVFHYVINYSVLPAIVLSVIVLLCINKLAANKNNIQKK